jgi:hypothetical protein
MNDEMKDALRTVCRYFVNEGGFWENELRWREAGAPPLWRARLSTSVAL